MKQTYTHQEKAALVVRVDELMVSRKLSQNTACAVVGISSGQITKWRRALRNGGLAALENNYKNCGRRPMYVPTPEESAALRELVLNTDPTSGLRVNKILAAQLFARDRRCSEELRAILEKLGAEVVYPERDMAIRLAHRLETARMLDFVQLSEKLNISKLLVPDALVGETVIKADLRKKYGVNIIAIEHGGKLIETIDPARAFESGDILFLSGTRGGLNRLSEWAKKSE